MELGTSQFLFATDDAGKILSFSTLFHDFIQKILKSGPALDSWVYSCIRQDIITVKRGIQAANYNLVYAVVTRRIHNQSHSEIGSQSGRKGPVLQYLPVLSKVLVQAGAQQVHLILFPHGYRQAVFKQDPVLCQVSYLAPR